MFRACSPTRSVLSLIDSSSSSSPSSSVVSAGAPRGSQRSTSVTAGGLVYGAIDNLIASDVRRNATPTGQAQRRRSVPTAVVGPEGE